MMVNIDNFSSLAVHMVEDEFVAIKDHDRPLAGKLLFNYHTRKIIPQNDTSSEANDMALDSLNDES